jgi:hypothetical protein
MTDLIVRLLLALLWRLDPGCLRCHCTAPEPPPIPGSEPDLPRHRSPYAAAAAASAADRAGATRRYPPPSPRPYAPAAWHAPENAASRLTQGRRRAELWLATVGIDAGPRRIHGVLVGAER